MDKNKKYYILPGKEPSVLIYDTDRFSMPGSEHSAEIILLGKQNSKTYYLKKELYDEIYHEIKTNEDKLKGRIDHRYDIPLIQGSEKKVFELIVCKSITIVEDVLTYVPSMNDEDGNFVPYRKLFHVQ